MIIIYIDLTVCQHDFRDDDDIIWFFDDIHIYLYCFIQDNFTLFYGDMVFDVATCSLWTTYVETA